MTKDLIHEIIYFFCLIVSTIRHWMSVRRGKKKEKRGTRRKEGK